MQNSYISNGDANLHWLLLQIENSSCTFPKNRWICQIRPQAIIADSRHQMSNWITTRVSFSPKYAISISFQYSRKTLKHVKSNIQWHIFTRNIFIYSWQHDFIDIFRYFFNGSPSRRLQRTLSIHFILWQAVGPGGRALPIGTNVIPMCDTRDDPRDNFDYIKARDRRQDLSLTWYIN